MIIFYTTDFFHRSYFVLQSLCQASLDFPVPRILSISFIPFSVMADFYLCALDQYA